ncbi:MAG: hypothetical protein AAFZ80_12810, partial [Cyanobacteria bacterium P01_A01_bin.105]
MNIEQQIQVLVDESPDPTTAMAVQAVAPLLTELAQQLRHIEYYILQNLDQRWMTTTLGHQETPAQQKRVVYAYPSLPAATLAAAKLGTNLDPDLSAAPYPVTHLLFQLLSLKQVDSFIFLEESGKQGQEIRRQDLAAALKTQLKKLMKPDIPSDEGQTG